MPYIEYYNNWGVDHAVLVSTMAFPEDEDNRNEFMAILIGKFIAEDSDSEDVIIAKRFLKAIISGPSYFAGLREKIRKQGKRAVVAGNILRHLANIVFLNQEYPNIYQNPKDDPYKDCREPSFSKALYLAGKSHEETGRKSGKELPSTKQGLRDNWNDFKNVAHLWAAYLEMSERGHSYPWSENLTDSLSREIDVERRSTFYGMAEAYRELAEKFKSTRNKTASTVLDTATTWKAPQELGITPFKMSFGGDGEWVKTKMKKYHLTHKTTEE